MADKSFEATRVANAMCARAVDLASRFTDAEVATALSFIFTANPDLLTWMRDTLNAVSVRQVGGTAGKTGR